MNDGHEVHVIDNLSSGHARNLDHLKGNKQLHVHIADIADHQKIEPLFAGVGKVFHLAALADIVPSIEQPLKYHHSNVNGTVSVLEACRKH
ncbi:MAG TPA: GDP-mannose 4,6-dehydratase, partial [Flavobacteriales bacterium]|nr:GDP-mannose 4,6-dehydratase [Flavobacteriales bacterium]